MYKLRGLYVRVRARRRTWVSLHRGSSPNPDGAVETVGLCPPSTSERTVVPCLDNHRQVALAFRRVQNGLLTDGNERIRYTARRGEREVAANLDNPRPRNGLTP